MAVSTTIYPTTVTWNSLTWNSTTAGGPIRAEYTHRGTEVADRTGDALYPLFLAIVDGVGQARVRLRDVKFTVALGTKSNLVFTLVGKATSVTVTLAGMVLVGVDPGEQGRAEQGTCTLIFAHESTDGTTVPVS